eukprot:320552-Chlamydomonas_euryale.AAC.20
MPYCGTRNTTGGSRSASPARTARTVRDVLHIRTYSTPETHSTPVPCSPGLPEIHLPPTLSLRVCRRVLAANSERFLHFDIRVITIHPPIHTSVHLVLYQCLMDLHMMNKERVVPKAYES